MRKVNQEEEIHMPCCLLLMKSKHVICVCTVLIWLKWLCLLKYNVALVTITLTTKWHLCEYDCNDNEKCKMERVMNSSLHSICSSLPTNRLQRRSQIRNKYFTFMDRPSTDWTGKSNHRIWTYVQEEGWQRGGNYFLTWAIFLQLIKLKVCNKQ